MIGVPAPAGRALYDLLRHRELYELFETTLADGETAEKTVRLADELVWHVTVVALPPGSRAAAVGVLRDVTRLERTESMRRTFVARRVPRAADADRLDRGGGRDARRGRHRRVGHAARLLDLIRRQSERMRELIDDLMDLAQIESGAVELHKEELSLLGSAARGRRGISRRRRRRGSIRVAVDAGGDVTVEADRAPARPDRPQPARQRDQVLPDGGTVRLYAGREGRRGLLLRRRRGPGNPARGAGEDLPALLPGRPLAFEDPPRHGARPRDRQAPRAAPRRPHRARERSRAGQHVPRPAAGGVKFGAKSV